MSAPRPGEVQYAYRHAIGGFFEFPTENARLLLPPHLYPVEPHHGQGVLSVMAFDFTDSLVGPYQELVLSVHVPPRVTPGRPLPRAAFYPFMLGTTTQAARDHAIALWHLPHFMHDIDVAFTVDGHAIGVLVAHGSEPILTMQITDYEWTAVEHQYQSFEHDASGSYLATMAMAGLFSENEEERGSLTLHPHAVTKGIDLPSVNTTPFRELWMRDGLQTFQPLETLTPRS